jgi:beta-N-acetylhexosaminidase
VSEVIGSRSLHRDPAVVSELGRHIIDEMQRQHFPAVGKHFPGHGAVIADSHQQLPVDHRHWVQLWEQDLRPFVTLTQRLDAIMPAHIVFSAMDHLPVGFSPFWLQSVLRNKLNFTGLIISDDLTMAAAATRGGYAERAVAAFLAGCDLLLICNNRPGAITALNALCSCDRRASAKRITDFQAKCAMLL